MSRVLFQESAFLEVLLSRFSQPFRQPDSWLNLVFKACRLKIGVSVEDISAPVQEISRGETAQRIEQEVA
jgi:hypothetical protein